MIRSSSRTLYKFASLYRSSPSVPLLRPPITSAVVRRFATTPYRSQTDGKFSPLVSLRSRFQFSSRVNGMSNVRVLETRSFSSKASRSKNENASEAKKGLSTVEEDPFDSLTYNIPDKPMTFTEGASYSIVILAGLGIAAVAGYGVFKELIFEPKEYKVFNKALARVQNDSQVRVRIGSPITGYGQETRNRAARQRIPNRVWKDDEGVEHIEVHFYIRGPHGAGKVFTEMFKDKEDKQWKFMYLQVEISSPSQSRMLLESYLPA
uniref:probable mitochondrial import inner membrane translocase subunit TIM21 n=1 Tax=Erigeron canadensis TaxID=72917 RepID=UPI001CB8BBED|nr:probable mitochondrial import inner membrane translocase subunit TIM21 [Erigeron canadensis]XP_043628909.1 probable mitochondrial import inner membrane translocase subunit TIM21 [Erigeron canadensis]XP_043628910.1 probable mitochondrial import inner membrane translocase subunit TIM21 [Erigeron canadensis]XP_043628911.1 probable mitochondrial import inner membrane translocase subunit TIM21 [Erigeron canadensis]XP_043628912.1 probable mitochondrial import inner membrane translocase subunit TIM